MSRGECTNLWWRSPIKFKMMGYDITTNYICSFCTDKMILTTVYYPMKNYLMWLVQVKINQLYFFLLLVPTMFISMLCIIILLLQNKYCVIISIRTLLLCCPFMIFIIWWKSSVETTIKCTNCTPRIILSSKIPLFVRWNLKSMITTCIGILIKEYL